MDDAELMQRIAAGDDDAFSTLYRAHCGTVLAFVRRRVGEPELALDLVAETFAEVVTSAATYRGDGPVIGWLLGIARHKLADSLRRGKIENAARRRLALEPMSLDDRDLERVEERASAAGPELERALGTLAAPIREALVARVVDEREYGAIAEELGCSEHLVRQRVHRGLARLRAALEAGR